MIEGAFYHLPGIGAESLKRLTEAGVRNWSDILSAPEKLPCRDSRLEEVIRQIESSRVAYENRDLIYLCEKFHPKDQWRILTEMFDETSWFDIETDGGTSPDSITCICGYRGEQVSTFVKGENLQDFISWLEETTLLVSFNGASFDVPRVLSTFAIPELPCAHIDLRWVAYHAGLRGGLKKIERELGVHRPQDLIGVDGAEAIYLWEDWAISRNTSAREKLLRYCAADTVGLKAVGAAILRSIDPGFIWNPPPDLWSTLEKPNIQSEPAVQENTFCHGISDREAKRMKAFLQRARERKRH